MTQTAIHDAPLPAAAGSISARASARASASTPFLAALNPEQRAAVEATEGPLLVLAGAGTGKTRVLTTRLAHLLASGKAKPWEILAVTFTNKAAREMRSRAGELIGPAAEGLRWLGTFHAVAAQMLRRHAELVGLRPQFTILDTDDQLRLLKQVIDAAGLDEKRWTARFLAALIDGWKNRALTPDRVPAGESFAFGNGKGAELYQAYQTRLAALNAVDFGDLLLLMIRIFQTHPDVLADYHQRLRYLMVDEYQDTNVAQYLWLRLLAQSRRNLCVVGDDDQSIYGWRGAEVENILRFEQDFPGAQIVRLERNYRSTGHILAAASGLIAANKSRHGKTLWTEDAPGDKVQVRGVWDGEGEARLIADDVERWRREGNPFADCAVLVRASWQMRAFEERFILLGIPYKVIGGPRFFERAEIRDAHAYLRLVRSADDDLAFERIVNTPKRGIGETTVQKLQVAARARGLSLAAIAEHAVRSDELRGPAKAGLTGLLRDLVRWRSAAAQMRHTDLAEMLLEESGYTDMLKADKSPQASSRLDNLKEMVQAMGQFDNLDAYLDHVSLVMDVEQGDDGDQVQISTLHAAKGLEWPLVFLPGWEEQVFPSQRALDESGAKALEEERRLAYVGLTRARRSARISFAANRQIFGRWQSVMPSRFVDELPEADVEAISETGYFGACAAGGGTPAWDAPIAAAASSYDSPGWRRMAATQASKVEAAPTAPKRFSGAPPRGATIEAPARLLAVSAPEEARFANGDRVFHVKFGYGRVRAVEGAKLTVDFDKAGEKRVVDSFVEPAP